MKNEKVKYVVKETIDIDEKTTIIIAERQVEKMPYCKDCKHCKYFGDWEIYYCEKYKGIVEQSDVCIEVGM